MRQLSRMMKWPGLRRRNSAVAALVVVALTTAGAAFAWHGFSSATTVSATFSANTVANSKSQTCTAANNDSIQVTEATFSGTATSTDSHLNGPITLDARSVYDATTNAGSLTADVSTANGFEGRLIAVNVKGQLQGLLLGRESGGAQVLGNVSSSFSTTAGFGSPGGLATIGSGTGTNTAIVSTSRCASSNDDQDNDGHGDNQGGHAHQFAQIGHQHGDDDRQD